MLESLEISKLNQVTSIFQRYIKRQGDRLNTSGIYCKRHAIQLRESLEKRAPDAQYHFGKVEKHSQSSGHLMHISGANYNYHYFVIANIDGELFALDPFLFDTLIEPIALDRYIQTAYDNPEDIVFGEPQI